MSFMPGGDSTGYTPLSPWGSPCPFVDESRELVMMDIQYDDQLADYTIRSSNVATGFYLPVDLEQISNALYVIENNGTLWKVTFPVENTNPPLCFADGIFVYPNPFSTSCQVYYPNPSMEQRTIKLYAATGDLVYQTPLFEASVMTLEKLNLAKGMYVLIVDAAGEVRAKQQVILY
jgi:hypothetical protein